MTAPKLHVAHSSLAFHNQAGAFIKTILDTTDRPVITLPTGTTPLSLYNHFRYNAPDYKPGFDNALFIQLDEFAHIKPDKVYSFRSVISGEILDPFQHPESKRIFFDPQAADPHIECERMNNALLRHGALDLAVLGLGRNGHIGFNEPGCSFDENAHYTALAPSTIKAYNNAATHGYTLGLGTLLSARTILLLVKGEEKANILKAAIHGPISEQCPASALQNHPNMTIIADEHAALKL